MEIVTIAFIVVGAIFILLEIILPGAISFCIGLSFLVIAFIYHNQIVTGVIDLIMLWCAFSIITSLIGVFIAKALFSGETENPEFVDTLDILGQEALVTEDITSSGGRIHYQGSWWDAFTIGETIGKDEKVIVTKRIDKKFLVTKKDS